MIEILLLAAVSTKMPSPPPPPPPPPIPVENVGLPGRETSFVKEVDDLPAEDPPSADGVQKLPNTASAQKGFNRRGNRNY